MITKTTYHLHRLPDFPRYVIVLPIICKKPKKRQFLLEQFRTSYPKRYREFVHRYNYNMIPFRHFDVYRADPFVFQPHIVIAGVRRVPYDPPFARKEDIEYCFRAIGDWMREEMPLVRDLCIGSPANITMSNSVARVATKIWKDDRHFRVTLFGRAKNVNKSYIC